MQAYSKASSKKHDVEPFSLISLKTKLTEYSALYNFFAVAMKRVDVVREALITLGIIDKSHAYRNQIANQDIDQITDSTATELHRLKNMF